MKSGDEASDTRNQIIKRDVCYRAADINLEGLHIDRVSIGVSIVKTNNFPILKEPFSL